jgi:RNA-directed DNA polymerase
MRDDRRTDKKRKCIFLRLGPVATISHPIEAGCVRKTIGKRMRAKLQQIKVQLRARMHAPVAQTGEWLRSVVQGYFNYHAVPGNLDSLGVFRERVTRLWRRTLLCRSQTHRLPWTRMHRLAVRWLPQPRVLHPYPEFRFAARYPR